MAQEKIQIRLSVLTEQIEEGWKLKPLAEHYGIPVSRMKDILKSANLRIRSFRGPQIELIDDTYKVSTEDLPTTEEKGSDFDLDESDLEENWDLNNAGSGDTITEEDNNNLTPNYTF